MRAFFSTGFAGNPQSQCQCGQNMEQMEARLNQKFADLQNQLAQLTATVKHITVVKEETPATVPDDHVDAQGDEACDIEISDDESPDPEQQRIAEGVLAEEWDTQASQDRLLLSENRGELGARLARNQMASLSGEQAPFDLNELNELKSGTGSDLLQRIHQEMQQIPEDQLRTNSRKNVRPEGQTVTLQMSLGLVISGTWRGIPMPSRFTYQHVRLQQLIFVYVEIRAREQGIDLTGFTFTSIQITQNLQTKRHKDKNNAGLSLIFTLGDHSGGELCVEDENAAEKIHKVRNNLVMFDGSRQWHRTKEFSGTRYAVVLYSMGTASYAQTPALTRAFLTGLGYRLPTAEFKDEITSEIQELAKKASRGEKVPDEPGRHVPPKGKRKVDETTTPSKRSALQSRAQEPLGGAEAAQPPEAPETLWSEEEITSLRHMKSPAKRWGWQAIAQKLNRSEESVREKWKDLREAHGRSWMPVAAGKNGGRTSLPNARVSALHVGSGICFGHWARAPSNCNAFHKGSHL